MTPGPLGRTSIRGAAWMLFAGFGGKVLALVVQLALGWMLTPEEFGLYAAALAFTIAIAFLIDGGAAKILAQRPTDFERILSPVTAFAIACNGLAAILIVAAAPLATTLFRAEAIAPLLWVIAVATFLRTPATVLRARMQVQLRFRAIAGVEIASATVRSVATIWLASAGYGAMALAAPMLVATIAETAALLAAGAGSGLRWRRFDVAALREVVRPARWIMIATAAAALAARGDYFVLGIAAPSVLGAYFFGFNLAQSMLTPATVGAQTVLLPSLSLMVNEPARFASAVSRAFRLIAFLAAPLAAIAWLAAPVAIHWLWSGRWDGSTPIAQSVAAAMVFRALVPPAYALIEARGRWALRAMLLALDGAGLAVAVGLAAASSSAGLATIAMAMAVQQSVFGLAIVVVAARTCGLPAWAVVRWPLQWASLAAVLALAARWVGTFFAEQIDPVPAIATLATFGVLWTTIVAAFARTEGQELLQMLPGRR